MMSFKSSDIVIPIKGIKHLKTLNSVLSSTTRWLVRVAIGRRGQPTLHVQNFEAILHPYFPPFPHIE